MDKEQKAKEYAEQFKVANAPIGSAIEMGKASKHYKAGFEAGKQERDRDWIDKLKENLNQKIYFANLIAAKDFAKGIECALEELENLSK